jgi:hypothetical protein
MSERTVVLFGLASVLLGALFIWWLAHWRENQSDNYQAEKMSGLFAWRRENQVDDRKLEKRGGRENQASGENLNSRSGP